MDEKIYEELLNKAYSELPEILHKKERFKIPNVTGKVQKNRTMITNFSEIAKFLARSESHMLKYFLKEAGVRGEISDGTLTLHSRFNPSILNKILKSYFKEYVVCSICNKPDTILKDDNLICNACGHREKVQSL